MNEETTCPYCLSPISAGETTAVCDSCGAIHHSECWDENEGCCVKNCRKVSRRLEVEVVDGSAEKLVLTRESVESAHPRRSSRLSNPCIKCGRQVPEGELYCEQCVPELEENQDTKNLGPLLIMLGIAAVLVAWFIMITIAPVTDKSKKSESAGVGVKVDR